MPSETCEILNKMLDIIEGLDTNGVKKDSIKAVRELLNG